MTIEQIIGLSLALLLMLAGLVGSIVPGLPGTPLMLIAVIGHRLYFGATSVNNWILVTLILLTIASLVFDFLAGVLGAKKFGSTWRGAVGAIIGGIVGLFFPFPGLILGPFLGAMLFELLGDRKFKEAARAGLGAMVGLILGVIGKFVVGVMMMLIFAVDVIMRSGH